jgi:N-glycosylase/DNA lyase
MDEDAVLTALAEQLVCYRRLAKLAQLQHEHVRQSRTEQLLDVLKSRQEVLEQVSAFERIVAPAKRKWGDYLTNLHPPDRNRAESLLAETRKLLEAITSADKDDAMVLQQRKLNLGKQINQTATARNFNRAYAKAAYGKKPSRMDLHQ